MAASIPGAPGAMSPQFEELYFTAVGLQLAIDAKTSELDRDTSSRPINQRLSQVYLDTWAAELAELQGRAANLTTADQPLPVEVNTCFERCRADLATLTSYRQQHLATEQPTTPTRSITRGAPAPTTPLGAANSNVLADLAAVLAAAMQQHQATQGGAARPALATGGRLPQPLMTPPARATAAPAQPPATPARVTAGAAVDPRMSDLNASAVTEIFFRDSEYGVKLGAAETLVVRINRLLADTTLGDEHQATLLSLLALEEQTHGQYFDGRVAQASQLPNTRENFDTLYALCRGLALFLTRRPNQDQQQKQRLEDELATLQLIRLATIVEEVRQQEDAARAIAAAEAATSVAAQPAAPVENSNIATFRGYIEAFERALSPKINGVATQAAFDQMKALFPGLLARLRVILAGKDYYNQTIPAAVEREPIGNWTRSAADFHIIVRALRTLVSEVPAPVAAPEPVVTAPAAPAESDYARLKARMDELAGAFAGPHAK